MTPDTILAIAEGIARGAALMFNAFFWDRLFPVVVVFGVLWLFFRMLASAQRSDSTFRAVDFLRDAKGGKPSWKRLIGSGAFVVHTIVLLVRMTMGAFQIEEIYFYGALWSGSQVILQLIAVWGGRPSQWGAQATPQPVRDPTTVIVQAPAEEPKP